MWEPGDRVSIRGKSFDVLQVLKMDFFSENYLLKEARQRYVLKLSRLKGLSFLPFGWDLAARLSRREYRLYRWLEGIEGIPRVLEGRGRNWLVHEFVEGKTLRELDLESRHRPPGQGRLVGERFFAELEAILRAVHARGVAYMDLSKTENIIAGRDGRPYLIDFQIGIQFKSRSGLRGRLFALLRREDLYQLKKQKRRFRPDLMTPAEIMESRRKSGLSRLHGYFLRRPWLFFKRRWLPEDY
jgi:predicted Ser/Thr protein kinase